MYAFSSSIEDCLQTPKQDTPRIRNIICHPQTYVHRSCMKLLLQAVLIFITRGAVYRLSGVTNAELPDFMLPKLTIAWSRYICKVCTKKMIQVPNQTFYAVSTLMDIWLACTILGSHLWWAHKGESTQGVKQWITQGVEHTRSGVWSETMRHTRSGIQREWNTEWDTWGGI